MTLDTDLQELRRLRHLQKTFATPAALYEEISAECDGQCEHPRMVAPLLSCCACKLIHDQYVSASALEKVVRQRIERDPGRHPKGNLKHATRETLALKHFAPRTHSGTHAGRMRREDHEKLRKLREQFEKIDDRSKDASDTKDKDKH